LSSTRWWKIPAPSRSSAQPQHRLVVELVGHPQPRLEDVLVGLREALGQAVEQALVVGVARGFDLSGGIGGEAIAGQDDPVEAVAPEDGARASVDDGRGRRVVERRIEHGDVVELGVPRRPVDVAEAAFEGEVRAHLPRVLQEGVHGEGAPLRA
jgi:hypothetical protein